MRAPWTVPSETVIDPVNDNLSAGYQYDSVSNRQAVDHANGNTIEKRVDGVLDVAYEYDSRDRLIGADAPSEVLEYSYDATGIRQSKIENGTRTDFLIDPSRDFAQVIRESSPTRDITYTHGDDLISQHSPAGALYYHYDGLGSTRALTDATEAVTDTYDYEAFGARWLSR